MRSARGLTPYAFLAPAAVVTAAVIFFPLAQTICAGSTDQSFGKASAFAIHSAAG